MEAEAIDQPTAEALVAHKYVLDWGDLPRDFGAVTAIERTQGGWQGTADPRGGGAAMGD